MPKSALIVSLHFSPAHASHMAAYGMLLRELGLSVSFLVDDKYVNFYDFARVGTVTTVSAYKASPASIRADIALFYNAALTNTKVARAMRRNGTCILYVFHEPIALATRLVEDWKSILKLAIAKACSTSMLQQSDCVLVPSEFGNKQFHKFYLRYNDQIHTLPLLFDDEYGQSIAHSEKRDRKWFSYLGNAVKAHHFDGFVAFAKFAIREGSNIPFTIATKTNLDALLKNDQELAQYSKQGKIRIQHGRVMSNEQMNDYYRESFCVWNMYRHTTQSGVLPRAFMTGAPVLARPVGSFPEYVTPGVNGEFVSGIEDCAEILGAIEKIRQNVEQYSEGARMTFLQKFYYKANRDKLLNILATCDKQL